MYQIVEKFVFRSLPREGGENVILKYHYLYTMHKQKLKNCTKITLIFYA